MVLRDGFPQCYLLVGCHLSFEVTEVVLQVSGATAALHFAWCHERLCYSCNKTITIIIIVVDIIIIIKVNGQKLETVISLKLPELNFN